jgi:hypothetical protein
LVEFNRPIRAGVELPIVACYRYGRSPEQIAGWRASMVAAIPCRSRHEAAPALRGAPAYDLDRAGFVAARRQNSQGTAGCHSQVRIQLSQLRHSVEIYQMI